MPRTKKQESRWNETPSAFKSRWTEKHGSTRWTTFPTGEESPLHIPEVERAAAADGHELMWAVDTVLGKPTEVGGVTLASKKGWERLQKGDYGADTVEHGGLILMGRPTALGDKERDIENRAATGQVTRLKQKAGEGIPVSGGDHPSARKYNKHVRSYEKLEIPGEE